MRAMNFDLFDDQDYLARLEAYVGNIGNAPKKA
jgi:hypothetical protein